MMEEERSLNTFFRPITDKAEFPEVRARMILQTYRIIHPTKTAPSRATRTNAASPAVPVTFRGGDFPYDEREPEDQQDQRGDEGHVGEVTLGGLQQNGCQR